MGPCILISDDLTLGHSIEGIKWTGMRRRLQLLLTSQLDRYLFSPGFIGRTARRSDVTNRQNKTSSLKSWLELLPDRMNLFASPGVLHTLETEFLIAMGDVSRSTAMLDEGGWRKMRELCSGRAAARMEMLLRSCYESHSCLGFKHF